MHVKSLMAALLIACLLTPARSSAQQTDPNEAGMWRTLVGGLEPAALVSVRLKDGTQFKGTVLRAGEDTFSVKPLTRIPVAARQVRFDDVVSIHRAKPSMSPGKKTLLGVGIGVAVYMVTAALLIAATGWD